MSTTSLVRGGGWTHVSRQAIQCFEKCSNYIMSCKSCFYMCLVNTNPVEILNI